MFLDAPWYLQVLIAFSSGFLTFLFPCLLSVVPVQLAVVGGLARGKGLRQEAVANSLLFVGGFLLIFSLLGLTVTSLGMLIGPHRQTIQAIGGLFLTFMGLWLFGVFRASFFYRELHIDVDRYFKKQAKLHTFLAGAVFGFAWTPCIGPVLAVILFWASQTETIVKGALLLVFFSLGMAVPFLALSLGLAWLLSLKHMRQLGHYAQVISATLLILLGIMLIFNKFGWLIGQALRLL